MQKMMAKKAEEVEKVRVPLADRRSQTHKRMDRWIRLQQFVYGLPDDYSYAICLKENGSSYESHTLVRVGWMNWYGRGTGVDRQHSLAVALLGTTEALSANPTATLMHTVVNRFSRLFRLGRRLKKQPVRGGGESQMAGELLAG